MQSFNHKVHSPQYPKGKDFKVKSHPAKTGLAVLILGVFPAPPWKWNHTVANVATTPGHPGTRKFRAKSREGQ
jgi:hypothetical protein